MAAMEIPIDFTYDDRLEIHAKPYWMFSRGSDRYGITAEIDVKIWKGIWAFADVNYYRAGRSDRTAVGLGLMLRFK